MSNLSKIFLCFLVLYGITLATPIHAKQSGEAEEQVDDKISIVKENKFIHRIFEAIYQAAERAYHTMISTINKILYKIGELKNKTLYERIV